MICEKCGHTQIDGEFCENCGQPLQREATSPEWSAQPASSTLPEAKAQLPAGIGSWKTLRWIIFGATLVLFGCGVLCGRFVFPRQVERESVAYGKQAITVPTPTGPTNTPGPSPTPTITNTPTATYTPTNTPTPVPTTVPGTILSPGEAWQEDDFVLRMELVAIQPEALVIDLVLENVGDETILFEVLPDMFRMISNLGDIVGPNRNSYGHFSRVSGFTGGSLALKPGERLDLAKNAPFKYNLANRDVTEIIVEVVGLSRIDRARWRAPIPH